MIYIYDDTASAFELTKSDNAIFTASPAPIKDQLACPAGSRNLRPAAFYLLTPRVRSVLALREL